MSTPIAMPNKQPRRISSKRLDEINEQLFNAVITDDTPIIPRQNEKVNALLTSLSDQELNELHQRVMWEFGQGLAEAALEESDVIVRANTWEDDMIIIQLCGYEECASWLRDMVIETKKELDRRKKLEKEKAV